MNIPQEDTDDASWEGAPVTNAMNTMNTVTESAQETAVVEKVWQARALEELRHVLGILKSLA